MQPSLKKSVIALLGVGHTNAHIVRMWKMHPRADAELICISDYPIATYSGMLPGVLAGLYPPEQMEIDLVRLCQSAGCRLVVDEVQAIDRARKLIRFERRCAIQYDVLSIGIGSRPATGDVEFAEDAPLELIKPMPTFLQRLTTRLERMAARSIRKIDAVVVGGGVGGIEISFCLLTRLKRLFPGIESKVTLVAGETFAGGTAAATQKRIRQALRERQIHLIEGSKVRRVGTNSMHLDGGSEIAADLVLWATAAIAPKLLEHVDVVKDSRGFLAIQSTLQTVSDDSIFAVGDTGTLVDNPSAKAGVFAVRQGPVLWENIGRRLTGHPLVKYLPQKNFLKLLNTGNGKGIGEYMRSASYRPLMWRIKNEIDVKFMKKYQDYRPMQRMFASELSAQTMRCVGCGGKVSSANLRAVLSELDTGASTDTVIGLQAADDAAVIACPEKQITATVDFFAAPFDDPYLMGKITAVHAASDCFAMGAAPTSALAMVQVPVGHPRGQQRVLRELLSGANDEFRRLGASIVGGHTIEGPSTLMGFTVLARQVVKPILKSGLKPGDRLLLTKPLGSGVLLAAHMRNQCRGPWFVELCKQMQQGNEICLELAKRYSISAMTDVTGFGLAGHLLEMLDGSQMRAALELTSIPALAGSLELIADGIESTLAPDNRVGDSRIEISATSWDRSRFQLLFDPQTSGGMLIGINPRDVDDVLSELRAAGFAQATAIGKVTAGSTTSNAVIDIVAS